MCAGSELKPASFAVVPSGERFENAGRGDKPRRMAGPGSLLLRYPLLQRVAQAWRSWWLQRPHKSQLVSFPVIAGRQCKRIVFRDSFLAARVEATFEQFGPSDCLPRLLQRYENEIWVEFVDGEPVEGDPRTAAEVGDFFRTVHSRNARLVPIAETVFLDRARSDALGLAYLGVIRASEADQLSALAQRLAPERLWVGFDYLDPVLKNFVRRPDGRLVAVDVEALRFDEMIGTGLAKCCTRWLLDRGRVLAQADQAVPGLSRYFSFVELCFLLRWTKRSFVQGKQRSVDPDRLRRLLAV